jgi:hypothetical protein
VGLEAAHRSHNRVQICVCESDALRRLRLPQSLCASNLNLNPVSTVLGVDGSGDVWVQCWVFGQARTIRSVRQSIRSDAQCTSNCECLRATIVYMAFAIHWFVGPNFHRSRCGWVVVYGMVRAARVAPKNPCPLGPKRGNARATARCSHATIVWLQLQMRVRRTRRLSQDKKRQEIYETKTRVFVLRTRTWK